MWLLRASVSCVLLCFSYVQAQPPVMPPAVLASLGQSAALSCDVGVKDNEFAIFFRQIPGEVPKLILSHHHSITEPRYGPGMSSAHYTATVNSAGTVYQFIIKDAQTSDTTTYYCLKWYPSLVAWVFSGSSKLVVTVPSFPEPSVVLFPPQPALPIGNSLPTLTCLISNLTVPLGTVSWTVNGKTEGSAVTSDPSKDSQTNTYSLSSYLTMPSVSPDASVTCQIQQAGSASVTTRSMKIAECI